MLQLKKYKTFQTPIINSSGIFAYHNIKGLDKPKMCYYSDLTLCFVGYPFWIKQEFYLIGVGDVKTIQ